MLKLQPSLLAIAVISAGAQAEQANDTQEVALDPVVVTSPASQQVLTVTTDPKAPRQPIPASDGASLLKNVPGFTVIRKGGTDGDPVFRGMAASRLGILSDGENALGGCGNRMDPPTAYIYPETYDEVVILKGPQTVKYGNGNSAGVVLFEREQGRFEEPTMAGQVSLTAGSADRNDQLVDLTAGAKNGYVRLNGSRSDANDYKDGNGDDVNSAYTRWSSDLSLGWTPSENTLLEISTARSDGEARYADRGMDGVEFARENHGIKFRQENISPLVNHIEAQLYQNYVDHVMDNFSLRSNSGMKMANNPAREVQGGKLASELQLTMTSTLDLGIDWQNDQHTIRKASDMMMEPDYKALARMEDMQAENLGLFTEYHLTLADQDSIHIGARIDHSKAEDQRMGRTTSGMEDDKQLHSGFLRYESDASQAYQYYAGIGHSERPADYWERMKNPAATSMMMTGSESTFDLDTEKTTQLDFGLLKHKGELTGSISAFYAHQDDFLLVESLNMFASNVRNIEARSWGAEADANWQWANNWSNYASIAWVRGENITDNEALGQIPPLEARLGLQFNNQQWSAGAQLRLVDQQEQVSPGTGTIVGQDLSETEGFATAAINAGYKVMPELLITAGIDNLFDKAYAEHISRSGAAVSGYEVTDKVNEPGRTWWLKAQWKFN
jgi:iron complex outermembrane receptor protein